MNRDAAKALADDIFDLAQREGGLIKDSLVDLLERSIDDSAVNRELRNENGILYAENLALRSRVSRMQGEVPDRVLYVQAPNDTSWDRLEFVSAHEMEMAAFRFARNGCKVRRA